MKKKIKYLSNAELLHEINLSKKSYCYFLDEQYADYDFIVEDRDDILKPDVIEEARAARVKRLNNAEIRSALLQNEDPTPYKNHWTLDDIQTEDIVFRFMTYEHIPPAKNPRNTRYESGKHVKIPFPPFKHYIVQNDEIKEVGRSHWADGIENGYFSPNRGEITPRLAKMFMKLVDRYSTKPNWRGYSYLDEMVADALVQLSAVSLKFNESKSNNPFAYYTQMITNSFRGRLSQEKRNQNLRDELLIEEGSMPSFSKQMEE